MPFPLPGYAGEAIDDETGRLVKENSTGANVGGEVPMLAGLSVAPVGAGVGERVGYRVEETVGEFVGAVVSRLVPDAETVGELVGFFVGAWVSTLLRDGLRVCDGVGWRVVAASVFCVGTRTPSYTFRVGLGEGDRPS